MCKQRFALLLLAGLFLYGILGMGKTPVPVQASSLPGFVSDPEGIPESTAQPTTAPVPTDVPAQSTGNPGSDAESTGSSEFVISGNRLVSYRGTAVKITIPSSVQTISSMAFAGNFYLKAVNIPDTVTKIEAGAFYNCPYLRYLAFDGNPTMQKYAVYNCVRFVNISAGKNTKPYRYALASDIPVVATKKSTLAIKKVTLLAGENEKNALYNTYQNVQWKSSKNKVVSVSSSGKMKAVGVGKAEVSATADGVTYTCQVTVLKRTINNRIIQISKSIISKKMTRYQKIRAVHNWMIAHVKYDYQGYLSGILSPLSHSARGALLKGVAVCDGYAYAFQKIMKHLHIPCRFVVGRSGNIGHGWNMVKLEGKWYHIDVTFDDPIVNGSDANTIPRYKYFLKSTSVMRRTHTWKISKYPKCKSKKYDG